MEDDDEIRCAILTGDEAGGAFSAGANLKDSRTHTQDSAAEFIKSIAKRRGRDRTDRRIPPDERRTPARQVGGPGAVTGGERRVLLEHPTVQRAGGLGQGGGDVRTLSACHQRYGMAVGAVGHRALEHALHHAGHRERGLGAQHVLAGRDQQHVRQVPAEHDAGRPGSGAAGQGHLAAEGGAVAAGGVTISWGARTAVGSSMIRIRAPR